MKKLLALLFALCMMTVCLVTVHADQYQEAKAIGLCDFQTVRIPEPEGEVDPDSVYFTQEFTFVPEEDGTYRFLVSFEEDQSEPYDYFMDVVCPDGYWELPNGCEFDAVAGETYELCFQYPNHDGRYPEFTFYVEEGAAPEIVHTEPIAEPSEAPAAVTETEEAEDPLPDMKTLLIYAGAAVAVIGAVVLLIAERKKNMNPDTL